MSFVSNLHTHTIFSDGTNTMQEYVQKAIEKKFVSLGFSDHGYISFFPQGSMLPEQVPQYVSDIRALQSQYGSRLEIYAGIEYDYLQPIAKEKYGLDYIIGSVHYVCDKMGKEYPVDHTTELFATTVHHTANDDIKKFVRLYYDSVSDMVQRLQPDIVGHLDLLSKFNKDNCFFDPEAEWYLEIVEKTVQSIAQTGCIAELNTAGYRNGDITEPYPHTTILKMLHAARVPMTISADAHSVERLDADFSKAVKLLAEVGYTSLKQLRGGKFIDISIA